MAVGLIQDELENALSRYDTLVKAKRDDVIAGIVLSRVQKEIQNLEGRYVQEARKENIKCISADKIA